MSGGKSLAGDGDSGSMSSAGKYAESRKSESYGTMLRLLFKP